MASNIDDLPHSQTMTVEFRSDTVYGSGNSRTRLALNWQDITKFCDGFSLAVPISGHITAVVSVLAKNGFDLTTPAEIQLEITSMPGFFLAEETTENGTKRYWSVPFSKG